MAKVALGTTGEAALPEVWRALVVEFITTFLFVFAGVGSAMATDKLEGDALVALFAVAVTHALVVAVMTSGGHIFGDHLNPAVTLGLLCGGHITLFRSVLYWIDQLLAAAAACYLLEYLSGGLTTPIHSLASGVGYLQGVIWEIVLTFSLLFSLCYNSQQEWISLWIGPYTNWVYWVGPLIGGGLAGFIDENFFIIEQTHLPIPTVEDALLG
ncbi:hypothetical protein C1H46_011790 [Malus baccata]|uniref:Tonoplast intrinsic protein n=1 Tax=Malus baccata TaxID=106549 RepID=A0A540MV18_MALBA|nr:hypothetical protein C1H46_011790 [Malus baccata]